MSEVIAVVGSSGRGGNTELLTGVVLEKIAERGFRTELIVLADFIRIVLIDVY